MEYRASFELEGEGGEEKLVKKINIFISIMAFSLMKLPMKPNFILLSVHLL